MLRFHAQTAGSTLTAQQPENNLIRVTLQALAATLGGTQSLHTNSFDEALGLPTEHAARLALRTQQVIGYETGIADTVDPLAGSYFIETLTTQIEQRAQVYLDAIDALGGAVAAIEAGYPQREIENAAYEYARSIDQGERIVVGLNHFTDEADVSPDVFPFDLERQNMQVARVRDMKSRRDANAVGAALDDVATAARGSANLLYPMKVALSRLATLGEVADALREPFGEYHPH
jgi:methylmalonyl-CoA mutase N-terminal domain/subunit